MPSVSFTILGQPMSLKNNTNVITVDGHGSLAKTPELKKYERDFQLQMPSSVRVMFEGPVRVTMRLFYSWNGPDLEEAHILDLMAPRYKRVKGKLTKVADGEYEYGPSERVMLAKGVYKNDRQVREKHIFHGIDKANPRAEIEVETMQMQQADLLDGAVESHAGDSYDDSDDDPPF